jgi:hypothetical protein
MSLDPPPYLSSIQNNIRARPIPWDGAVRAGTITDDQLSKIRAVDKVRKEVRKQTIESDLEGYRILFVGGEGKHSVLQSAARRADVVQYILVLLSDLLDGVYAYLPCGAWLIYAFQRFPLSRKRSLSILIPTSTCYHYSLKPMTLTDQYHCLHLLSSQA